MEHRVDTTEGGWEVKTVGDGGDDGGDGEGSDVTRAEFGGGVGGEVKIGGGEANTVADLEGDVTAMLVGGGGIASFGGFDLTVDGGVDVAEAVVDVGGGGVGGRRGILGVVEGGGGERVETIVGEEGSHSSAGVDGIVVGGFGDGEVGCPIVLHGVTESAEDLLDGAVGAFGLAVGLRVVGGGDVERRAKMGPERLPDGGDEAGIAVGDDAGGEAVEAVDVGEVKEGGILCGDGMIGGGEMGLFRKHIDEGDDGGVGAAVETFGRG